MDCFDVPHWWKSRVLLFGMAMMVALLVLGGMARASGRSPQNTAAPAMSGEKYVGGRMTTTTGDWTNSPTGFAFQWLRCDSGGKNCNPISGAAAQSYTFTAADFGVRVRVTVTATNADGSGTSASKSSMQIYDNQAPSTPIGLSASQVTQTGVTLSWNASSDDVSVAGYDVTVDNSKQKTKEASVAVSGFTCNSSHSVVVDAYDASGNASVPAKLAFQSAACPPPVSSDAGTTSGGTRTTGSYDQAVLADTPVMFLDMAASGSSESDLAGNGHIGSYKNGTPSQATMPNGDSAADFNGTNQYLTVPSAADLSIPTTRALTWEAWIRPDVMQFPDTTGGYTDFLGKCQSYSPSCEWEGRMYNASNSQDRCSRISAYVFNPSAGLGAAADWQPASATGSNCTSSILQTGQWLHVVGEYQTVSTPSRCSSSSPGSIEIWVNGVQWNSSYHGDTGCMSQYGIKPQTNSSPFDVGTMAFDAYFAGAVGKVAVYDHLLTPAQIAAHFAAMTGAAPSGSCQDACTIPVPTP
jgi:hypothetical protein